MKEEFPLPINLEKTTLPKLLKSNAERFGAKKTALREKSLGIWRSYSWQEYYDNVKYFSMGLTSLGLVKGDKVAILGNNRPAFLYAEIAAQAAGAISVGLYQDSTVPEVAQLLEQCDVRYVVAEDQEQVDKLLEIRERYPALAGIIYCDRRGMRHYRRDCPIDCLISFQEVQKLGAVLDEKEPGLFERQLAEGKGDDIAVICTTSGSTGTPRGALLSHRNLLSMAESLNQVDAKRETDEFVSILPLAWFGEQMISLASALTAGFTVNFPEKPETVMADLREIGPQLMFSPPRLWESIAATVQVKIMETTPFKRFMFTTFMGVGRRIAAMKLAGEPVPFSWRILGAVAHLCLFRALRDRLGLARVRSALTGGSALGSDVFVFFHAMGVNLKQAYGLTELSGISCIHRDGEVRGETVGLPLPGTEIRLSPAGEILVKGPGVFQGYYKDDRGTAAVLEDGWLRTGDAGRLDDNGHLVVNDRLRDVTVLADGSHFAPRFAEAKLKFSPYVREAVVLGNGNPGLQALICLDGRVAGKWAGDHKLSYTTYSDLAARPELYDLIELEVAAVNRDFPESARIDRFALLYKELDADDGELTRTGKVRRGIVAERFREIIEAMQAGRDAVGIDATIDLQDGRSARIQTTVQIRKVSKGDH